MKKPQIKRDGDKFYVDTSAGRLSGDEVGDLQELAMKIEQNRPRPPEEFLVAWKEGVWLAGPPLFTVRCDKVDAATEKDQLRPDLEVITASLGGMSPGERVFILSLYQFFSDSTVVELSAELGYPFPTLADIASMDSQRRAVIARLLETYSGW